MKITKTTLQYSREPIHPLGFKGGHLDELWQITAAVEADGTLCTSGYGVQSVLWSDSAVFHAFGPERSNALMFETTQYALRRLEGETLVQPEHMLRGIFDDTLAYAKRITGHTELRATFVLNALTPVDWALWKLWHRKQGCAFRELVRPITDFLVPRQRELGNIPLISYATGKKEIEALADEGRSLFKIKIGCDPDGRNDADEMLQWDIARLAQIHAILSRYATEDTACGHPAYYLDANGRYDTPDRLLRFLDAADRIGALERIVLLEEPFPENALQCVDRIPVPVAGDESAHSEVDAVRLIEEYGYSAIALKPIAKTLSVSLAVLEQARRRGVQCFCADLTVNPKMVEMNKLFASHLPMIMGMNIGVFESNGSQNYLNWVQMQAQSGLTEKSFTHMQRGRFILDEAYYRCEGNVWED